MKSTRKNALAILLALLMTASSLAGCSGTDDDVDDEPRDLEDWNVFLVQNSSDLPACESSTDGRLYYVSSESGFHACSNGAWEAIDLTGPSGAQGPDGAVGPAGPAGPAGADGEDGEDGAVGPAGSDGAVGPAGSDGTDGADGTSFTIIGTVEETSDLGEVYIGESGDAFMVNSTVHIHVWTGSEWIDLGNISGPQGSAGLSGEVGPAGADGPTGDDGLNALIHTSPQSAGGTNCPMGGTVVRIGMDDDRDGTLSTPEVDQTLYVCNGVNGVDGNDGADGADGVNGVDGNDGADGADGSLSVVMEMDVTVTSMKFYIDSILQADVTLYRGFTYTFDQSASSNSAHPFRLSTTSDGTHGGGSQYTDGVTYTGTQGSTGLLTFTVPLDAPDTLYYYCQNHGNMGGEISIQSLGSVS